VEEILEFKKKTLVSFRYRRKTATEYDNATLIWKKETTTREKHNERIWQCYFH
jgi:hypothetical protein